MAKCSGCGADNSQENNYCGHCGQRLGAVSGSGDSPDRLPVDQSGRGWQAQPGGALFAHDMGTVTLSWSLAQLRKSLLYFGVTLTFLASVFVALAYHVENDYFRVLAGALAAVYVLMVLFMYRRVKRAEKMVYG
jgi:hypothetical protein